MKSQLVATSARQIFALSCATKIACVNGPLCSVPLVRSPSPITGDSPSLGRSSFLPLDASGRESMLSTRKEKVVITCLGILYSPIIMTSMEGEACPDTTHFLMAGTQVSCYWGN